MHLVYNEWSPLEVMESQQRHILPGPDSILFISTTATDACLSSSDLQLITPPYLTHTCDNGMSKMATAVSLEQKYLWLQRWKELPNDPSLSTMKQPVWTMASRTFKNFRQFVIVPVQDRYDNLLQLDAHKSVGPNGIHPRVLNELANVIMELFSIIFQESWESGEVSVDWSWQMFSQFSRMVRRNALVITSLSDSLQCLEKLWSYWKTLER